MPSSNLWNKSYPTLQGQRGGRRNFSKPLSDTKITPSDEAFAPLCCKNMWEKWNADDNATTSHHKQGKYTSNRTQTGSLVAGQDKACNVLMSSFRRLSSIKARNGHQLLRV